MTKVSNADEIIKCVKGWRSEGSPKGPTRNVHNSRIQFHNQGNFFLKDTLICCVHTLGGRNPKARPMKDHWDNFSSAITHPLPFQNWTFRGNSLSFKLPPPIFHQLELLPWNEKEGKCSRYDKSNIQTSQEASGVLMRWSFCMADNKQCMKGCISAFTPAHTRSKKGESPKHFKLPVGYTRFSKRRGMCSFLPSFPRKHTGSSRASPLSLPSPPLPCTGSTQMPLSAGILLGVLLHNCWSTSLRMALEVSGYFGNCNKSTLPTNMQLLSFFP